MDGILNRKEKKEHLFSVPSHPPHPSLVTCYKTKKKNKKQLNNLEKKKWRTIWIERAKKLYFRGYI